MSHAVSAMPTGATVQVPTQYDLTQAFDSLIGAVNTVFMGAGLGSINKSSFDPPLFSGRTDGSVLSSLQVEAPFWKDSIVGAIRAAQAQALLTVLNPTQFVQVVVRDLSDLIETVVVSTNADGERELSLLKLPTLAITLSEEVGTDSHLADLRKGTPLENTNLVEVRFHLSKLNLTWWEETRQNLYSSPHAITSHYWAECLGSTFVIRAHNSLLGGASAPEMPTHVISPTSAFGWELIDHVFRLWPTASLLDLQPTEASIEVGKVIRRTFYVGCVPRRTQPIPRCFRRDV